MASCPKECGTAVVYDSRLSSHYSAWNLDFTEIPQRNNQCIERCSELGLLQRCFRVPMREASEQEMLLHHTLHHIEMLRDTESMSDEDLKQFSQKYDYIYFHQKSFQNAKLALGGSIDLVDKIVSRQVQNGLAIVRPPGHHAMEEEYSGYCYLANAVVAAKFAIQKHSLKRILILDWDVHHGQGTQFAFYDDPRVLYVSIHRYEQGLEWPHLREGDYDFIGDGPGKGYNINVPLNETGCGDSEYLCIFFNLLLPIFYEFDPELVIVSAGFDSAIGCPEGEMKVTPACFAHFVNLLSPLASGKLALLLEGGYNLKSLAESTALCLRALLGDPTPLIQPLQAPKTSVVESILNCVKVLRPHWHSLAYQEAVDLDNIDHSLYPFKQVLKQPPEENVQFYTPETRPQTFPLIQDCADNTAIQLLKEHNKTIDRLIQETNLNFPSQRCLVWYDHASAMIEDGLRKTGIWVNCQKDVSVCQPCHVESVKAAVDSVLLSQSQCSLCLTSLPKCQQNVESPVTSSPAHLAMSYAMESYAASRVLLVQLGDDLLNNIQSSPSVLSIGLSYPSAQCKSCDKEGSHVDVILDGESMTDSDILAAFQQIVLPLAYEFSPTITIFQWVITQTQSEAPSSPCMSQITQLLKGLSGGRLLMMVEHHDSDVTKTDSMCDSSIDRLEACARVLNGEMCYSLKSGLPSDKNIDVIKQVQDQIKDRWRLLAFRCQIPKL